MPISTSSPRRCRKRSPPLAEIALLDRLVEAGLATPAARLTPFRGGYKNQVVLIEEGGRRLVAKSYRALAGDDNPYYPNRPSDEAAVLALLAPHGLAPSPLWFEPEGAAPALLVYAFAEGEPWRADPAVAARLITSVHGVAAPAFLRRVAATPSALIEHGEAMLSLAGTGDRELIERRPVPVDDEAPPLALLHTDCGPGNIIVGPAGALLVDWQCPALGDAAEDIACFLSPAMMVLYRRPPHDDAAADAFLAACADRDAVARYRARAAFFHWRIAAYCRYRAESLAIAEPETAALYGQARAAELALLRRGTP